jgi:hypothetical protein
VPVELMVGCLQEPRPAWDQPSIGLIRAINVLLFKMSLPKPPRNTRQRALGGRFVRRCDVMWMPHPFAGKGRPWGTSLAWTPACLLSVCLYANTRNTVLSNLTARILLTITLFARALAPVAHAATNTGTIRRTLAPAR